MQITRGGDWRDYRYYKNIGVREHEGIDLKAIDGNGNPVGIVASAPGTVEQIRYSDLGGYGKFVKIKHIFGNHVYKTWYAHLSRIKTNLSVGQKVSRGELIGIAGSTGNSTGIHLHFGVEHVGHGDSGNFIWGDWVNPRPLLGI